MSALSTLFPVFFIMALGFISRKKRWITPEQKDGANAIVFKILFPILVFQLISTAEIELQHLKMIVYVFIVFTLALVVGKLFSNIVGKQYAHFSPYLLTVCEGGNVALPLYLSIVGASSNTVIFDIAGTIVGFIVFPILVSANSSTFFDILKRVMNNSFVIAVILGMVLNITGIYHMAMMSQFKDLINNTLSQATMPIITMILFILGYNFTIDRQILRPLLKLMGIKIFYYTLVILGFFVLFPKHMVDKTFMIAPMIYFMSPTGFGLLPVIEPLYKSEDDASFTSAFVSIFMIVTLLVYTCIVIFIS
ncbi:MULTISPECIES: AEC family transporter [unclassified Clostridioides]|uniref:AEC family transporter n=1 Tax=unclassified Clostridioides TaxID=2635829 RepID=UPI001D0FD800|nr:AEC family transporter [Clostridioides sp. ES-S-0056-01]MCC0713890.1 AEC family transporter [Clostridioides sp. ES-S-0077-01]